MNNISKMLAIGAAVLLLFSGDAAAKDKKLTPKKVKVVKVTLTKDNTLSLRHAFYGETTGNLVNQARKLDARLESKDPIFLVLDSPGGSISAGLNAIENLKHTNRKIHTITMFAASMGFETVQGLGKRLITPNGTLMSHKAWGFFYGEFPGQLDSRYTYWLKRYDRMTDQAVKRTNGIHTKESYLNLIENEYWCDGVDCINQGFADYIVKAKCDKSLSGSYVEPIWQFMFFGHIIELKVEFPDCPLNTGYLAYDIYIDGQPLYGNIKADKEVTPFNNFKYDYKTGSEMPIFTERQLSEIKDKAQKALQTINSRKVIVEP